MELDTFSESTIFMLLHINFNFQLQINFIQAFGCEMNIKTNGIALHSYNKLLPIS